MKRILSLSLVLLGASTFAACDFDFDADVNDAVLIDLGDLAAACEGQSTVDDGEGNVTVCDRTLSTDAEGREICRYECVWSGDIVDVAGKVDKPDNADLTLESGTLTFSEVFIQGDDGQSWLPPELILLDASVELAGSELASLHGENESGPFGAPIEVELNGAQVNAVQAAVINETSLMGDASATIVLLETERQALANNIAGNASLEIRVSATLNGTATASIF